MKLDTYLRFNGDCRSAFEFYARCLGGTITAMMSFDEGGAEVCAGMTEEVRKRIMHARLEVGAFAVMGTDATPGHEYRGIVGAHVVAQVSEPAEAERVFAALAEGGSIEMPLGETFWALRFGVLIDRFGVPWMVNCGHPQ